MPKALKNITRFKIIFILLLVTCTSYADSWVKLAPGIEYLDVSGNSIIKLSHIHAFKIDLKHNNLQLALAKNLSAPPAFVDNFAKQNNSVIALNGGFFDKSFHPLGLRVSNSKQYNPIKYISWWGVFYVKDKVPAITTARNYNKSSAINFAVQSGPRLIVDGKIPSLKEGYAERSALGITNNNKVIILVTQNNPISTTKLAKIMRSEPLNCQNALNLDGGSSSQLYVDIKDFKLNVSGFSEVSDAILVSST